MTTIPEDRSPCRRHPCSVEHADVVRSFWDIQRQWRADAEAATGAYETEMASYSQNNPQPTFRDYLIRRKR
jgi:hypothetical protein